jgi:hypothetical protein
MNNVLLMEQKLKHKLMQSEINHKEEVKKANSFEHVHLYFATSSIIPQSYGGLAETYMIEKLKYVKNNSNTCQGDFTKGGLNFELKVSLGGNQYNKFNFVQIRLTHEIHVYLLTAFCAYLDENLDLKYRLFIFSVPKDQMKELIKKYGSYAHGTKKKNGNIKNNVTNGKNIEYALRVKYGSDCWKYMEQFLIPENTL